MVPTHYSELNISNSNYTFKWTFIYFNTSVNNAKLIYFSSIIHGYCTSFSLHQCHIFLAYLYIICSFYMNYIPVTVHLKNTYRFTIQTGTRACTADARGGGSANRTVTTRVRVLTFHILLFLVFNQYRAETKK